MIIDLETIGYFLFMEEQEKEQQKAIPLNSPDTEEDKEYYSNGRNN